MDSLDLSLLTAMAATPILQSNFDEGLGAWAAMGEGGNVRVSKSAADMRDGKASLAFDYEIGPKKFGVGVMPVEPGKLAAMDQVHLWVKTDYATSVLVLLSEKGGGNYTTIAWSPGGVWQEIKAEPRDFSLGDKPTDPPDPDGKLDLDQVQGIGIADLGQIFGAAPPNPNSPIAMVRHPGKHTLLIGGMELLSGAGETKDKLAIDAFDKPQIAWTSPGGANGTHIGLKMEPRRIRKRR